MKLIVGLGNPGIIYEKTRHNLGARTVKCIAKKYNKRLQLNRSLKSRIATIRIKGHECMVAVPQTFMNLSGESVALVLHAQKISARDILIVHDDMDLELGVLRLKRSGGAGGHKGIDSVIKSLRTNEFNRLKLGIGRPYSHGSGSDYVLSVFSKKERRIIDEVVQRAIQICSIWVECGIEGAMNQLSEDTPLLSCESKKRGCLNLPPHQFLHRFAWGT